MLLRESTGLVNNRIKAGGKSLADALADGTVQIRSGTMPATADLAVTGDLLCRVTLASGAFTSGAALNGINLDVATEGKVYKATAETWSGVNLMTGTAGYGVYYANTVVEGASTTAERVFFDIATSGAFLNMTGGTSVYIGELFEIDSFYLEQPK